MISYKKIFHGIVWCLFLGFLVLYLAQANGYYEDVNNKKSTLTEEKIKQFEEDVSAGKKIKVEDYVVNLKKDYSNPVSNFGLYTSKVFAKYFKKGMNRLFSDVSKSVSE